MAVIQIIRTPATPEQIADMLQAFGDFIKLAVDVERGILTGGGNLHADCEKSFKRTLFARRGPRTLGELGCEH